jgi:parallel beta-helix repeat protein
MKGLSKRSVLGVSLAVSCLVAVMTVPADAATLCVQVNNGNCYSTISSAVAHALAGDTIMVAQGVYQEDVVIGMPLTLVGANAANTIIDASGKANGIYIDGLDNSGVSGVTVTGFTVKNANFEGILITNGWSLNISGNRIVNNDRSLNFAAQSCPGLPAFETSEGQDCGEGIHLSGVANSTISGNLVENNSGGILISDETAATHDNLIQNNIVQDNVLDCGITMPSHPPAFEPFGTTPYGVYGNTVSGNTVLRNGIYGEGAGIGLFGFLPGARVSGNTISGNRIIGNGLPGVTMHAHSPFENMSNNTITGNYISDNGADPSPQTATPGPAGINLFIAGPVPMEQLGIVVSKNVIKNETDDVVLNTPEAVSVNWNNLNGVGMGVVNLGPASIDATNNWWGCAMGPNANGCSAMHSPNVSIVPYMTSPAVPNGSPAAQ